MRGGKWAVECRLEGGRQEEVRGPKGQVRKILGGKRCPEQGLGVRSSCGHRAASHSGSGEAASVFQSGGLESY